MSDDVAQSCNDNCDGVTKQAVVHSHHSPWMAHWMSSTSCKSATKPGCGPVSISFGSKEVEHDANMPERGKKNDSKCGRGSSELPETKGVKVPDHDNVMAGGSEKFRNPFSMFNLLQRKADNVLARKDEQGSSSHWGSLKSPIERDSGTERHFSSMLQWVPEVETVSREKPLDPRGSSEYPQEDGIIENNNLAIKNSVKGDLVVSSKIVPYGYNLLKTPIHSVSKPEETNRLSFQESGERMTNTVCHSNSLFLVNEKAVNDLFEISRNPFARPNELALFPHDPSTSRSQEPEFVCHGIQDHTGIGLFPSKNKPVELSNSEKLYRQCFSVPSVPCSKRDYDMEAVRTYATVDSMKDSSRGPKKFSSAQQFLVTKRSAFEWTERGQILKESTVSTKMKEKASTEFFHFDQHNGSPIRTGVKLQLLGSSSASEEEKDADDLKTSSVNLKNESSAETNIMDLDTFRKNHVSGVISSSSNRHTELDLQSPRSQTVLASARGTGGRLLNTKLLDVNQEPNNLAAYVSSADTSTSKTQSLDAEHLLSNAEHPTNVKSTASLVGFLEPELSSRWVKRLKLSPTSARGTQSSKMGGDYSHEKVNNFFNKIMKCSVASSEPFSSQSDVKGPTALNQRTTLWNGKPSSIKSVRENRDATLSHPWIQRLRHNAVSTFLQRSKPVEISKLRCSKASMDKIQKKQFPSLAAMALMGKAMGEFRSCQFRKKGSAIVWSS